MIESTITWHEITDIPDTIPDAEAQVLVYDGYLDDVVTARLAYDSEDAGQWLDLNDNPLPDPQFWAEIPFPKN
ncbi:MAG: hypothetical protein VR65_06130 [Desulfobulbaceae bacterium BRH_c16a]|nr:MAG: hypothetical protein VR65_06130 [Desulfobulbaceae bacterium BRH_c16a]